MRIVCTCQRNCSNGQIVDSSLANLNAVVGQCKAECGTFMHIGIQHQHKPCEVYTHQNTYIEGLKPIDGDLLIEWKWS